MKAIQHYSKDTESWEYKYSYPMGDEEAKTELKQQRRWARDDDRDDKYRIVEVEYRG
uniref:Uncharacterized protein n=1 Tax=viral metagenome TaxID=1070528 RepID=A0A6M3KD82_9ZZZZ